MMQSALKQTILAVILKITPPELETPAQAETLIRWARVASFRSAVSLNQMRRELTTHS